MRKAAQEAFVLEFVRSVRAKDPGIGGMNLWYMYRQVSDGNCPVGRDRYLMYTKDLSKGGALQMVPVYMAPFL